MNNETENNNKNKLLHFSFSKLTFYVCTGLSLVGIVGSYVLPQSFSDICRMFAFGGFGGAASSPYIMKIENFLKEYFLFKLSKKNDLITEGEPLNESQLNMLKEEECALIQNNEKRQKASHAVYALNNNLPSKESIKTKGSIASAVMLKNVTPKLTEVTCENEQNFEKK